MPPRLKKLIGFLGFLPFLGLYFFAAAALGERLPAMTLVQAPYYMIAGVAWAFPAKYLIQWMNAEPRSGVCGSDRDTR